MDIVSVLVVFIATVLASIGFLYAYGMSNLQDIKDTWVEKRCNPIYMPMAGAVGSDIGKNFTFCVLQSVNKYAGFVMDPIYKNFAILTNMINTILDSMNSIRSLVTGASTGFLGIINSTFGKIQNTFGTTIQMVNRVRAIMSRMMTVFAIMMNIVSTGIYTGESVNNGPIGDAARFLCFRPSTKIETMSDGTIPICLVEPGMRLADGQVVKSVLSFDGSDTPMSMLGDVCVSGNHKVMYENAWIRVEDHPDAKPAPTSRSLYCLNTEKHTIPIAGYLFKDYEETDSPVILGEFFRRVELHYGTAHSPTKIANPLRYRYTGIAPNTAVMMADGMPRLAENIRVGESLRYGGRVIGIVYHRVPATTRHNGIVFSAGTWIRTDYGVEPILGLEKVEDIACIQFLTHDGYYAVLDRYAREVMVLDDQEVTDESIHTWRDNEVQKEQLVI